MSDYRFLDLDLVRYLVQLLDGCSAQASSIATALDRQADHHGPVLRRVGYMTEQRAALVRR